MNAETTARFDRNPIYVTYCDGIGCNASTRGALKGHTKPRDCKFSVPARTLFALDTLYRIGQRGLHALQADSGQRNEQ